MIDGLGQEDDDDEAAGKGEGGDVSNGYDNNTRTQYYE